MPGRHKCSPRVCCSSCNHCCVHVRYLYDEDTRPSANSTEVRKASVKAWLALYDGTPAAVNNDPRAKGLYEWYKVLRTSILRDGVLPPVVEQVRLHHILFLMHAAQLLTASFCHVGTSGLDQLLQLKAFNVANVNPFLNSPLLLLM